MRRITVIVSAIILGLALAPGVFANTQKTERVSENADTLQKPAAVVDQSPTSMEQQQVEVLHAALIAAMQTEVLAEREKMLTPVILAAFDVPSIARISLGRTWKELAPANREQFVGALGELIVATYADRFDTYNDQQFVTRAVKTARTGAIVQTSLVKQNGESVSLDYFFRGGKIFNVVADGVSDLSLRRADYNAMIKQHGYDALLAHIKDKTTTARAG